MSRLLAVREGCPFTATHSQLPSAWARVQVRIAEALLGVGDMVERLTKRAITVNGEVSMADHTPANAAQARDALVKIMYAQLARRRPSRAEPPTWLLPARVCCQHAATRRPFTRT